LEHTYDPLVVVYQGLQHRERTVRWREHRWLQDCNEHLKRQQNSHITHAYDFMICRKFSGDESFLKDPNAYNDAKNAATLEVIDEPVSVAGEKAEDKSRL
jgi:hypothetical protein